MFKTKLAQQSFKRVGSGLVATALGLATCLAPAIANATTTTGTPGWVRATTNELRVILGSTEFYAYSSQPPGDCPTVSVETLQQWQSLAQAALLSGKRVGIGWFTCNSGNTNYMYVIELSR